MSKPASQSTFERVGNALGKLIAVALSIWFGWAIYQWIVGGGIIVIAVP